MIYPESPGEVGFDSLVFLEFMQLEVILPSPSSKNRILLKIAGLFRARISPES